MDYLLWLGVPISLIILGVFFFRALKDNDSEAPAGISVLGTIIGAIFLLIMLIVWPVYYCSSLTKIEKFKAIKKTVEVFRQQGNLAENTALILEATETNAWLKSSQYWASKPLLRMFWPQEILDIEPIK